MMKSFIIGCVLTAVLSFQTKADSIEYFGELRYNHASLHVPIEGIMPFKRYPKGKSHFQFKFDDKNRIVEIVNHTFGRLPLHPLTHFGAHRISIDYENGQEIRRYFDIKNQPMLNIRGVHMEVFSVDEFGFKTQLDFYDIEGKAKESLWHISRYQWKKLGNKIVESRFNLVGEEQNLSPYFAFKNTAIEYGKDHRPYRTYNLNSEAQPANSEFGVAYYQDEYNDLGQHIKYSYFDKNNKPAVNPFGFSYATKRYDSMGKLKNVDRFDLNDQFMPRHAIAPVKPANSKDRENIKQVSLNYIIALQSLDSELMANTLHKDLAKSMVRIDQNGKKTLRKISYQRMLHNAKNWNKTGTRFPPTMNNQVTIFDVYHNMAAVKLTSDNWVEYLHLIKINGRWQVKDLVWDHNNI